MHKIQIDNIQFANPKTSLQQPINIQITFSALDPITKPLLWKVIYVGSAFTQDHDQTLEEFQIAAITEPSTLSFQVQCQPPDYKKIPRQELICTTALIICVSYSDQEFLRIGYYIHNAYVGDEEYNHQMELSQVLDRSERFILIDKPRITKIPINWGDQLQHSACLNPFDKSQPQHNPNSKEQHPNPPHLPNDLSPMINIVTDSPEQKCSTEIAQQYKEKAQELQELNKDLHISNQSI